MSRLILDHELLGLGIAQPVLGDDGEPVQSSYGGFGKWGRTGTPHSGWEHAKDKYGNPVIFNYEDDTVSLYFKDGRDDVPICEMCEKAPLLFVHTLVHPDYHKPLYCGARCAGHMIGNPALAAELEKAAKWIRKARMNCRAEWRLHPNGNMVANVWGFVMAVKLVGRGYVGWFKHKPSGYSRQSKATYATLDEAKRVTVNAMLKARYNKPWKPKVT